MDIWTPAISIFVYLAIVLYIGIFAFRRGKETGEDFFLASRSVGSIVFFLSLFATNMTAFAIIGSSGMAYKIGIGVFAMMATSSALVIPLTLFFIGTRLWSVGKRFGHMTQVSYFRDRWECSEIGTLMFVLTAAMMLPYLIISIIGGGTILETLTDGHIPYALGGAIVALVVMGNVFFGGMRGAVLVNVFQTILFLAFGVVAVAAIGHHINFTETVERMKNNPVLGALLTRSPGPNNVPPGVPVAQYLSYMLIPLSSIMFPHMSIMCFTAKRVTAFKKTVVLYPLCIMFIWLPCVFLGTIAAGTPDVSAAMAAGNKDLNLWAADPAAHPAPKLMVDILKVDGGPAFKQQILTAHAVPAPREFSKQFMKIATPLLKTRGTTPQMRASKALYATLLADIRPLAAGNGDSALLQMLKLNVWPILAGVLAAGIISAVMGSDCHQILALSTMFTKDIFDYYGGRSRFGEKGTVFVGRTFIVLANLVAYLIALGRPEIFELAVQYAFGGFASLAPLMVAALFWKRSTKHGALLAILWVAACVIVTGILEHHFHDAAAIAKGELVIWKLGSHVALSVTRTGFLRVFGCLPVVPMLLGSTLLTIIGSLLTPPPSSQTIARYFPSKIQRESWSEQRPATGAAIT